MEDLIRVVRMTFDPAAVDDFLTLFRQVSPRIRRFEGCKHLELWEDRRYPNVFTTYSIWQSEEHLEVYRKSELFRETWAQTRRWFAAPPQAHSYRRREQVNGSEVKP